MEFTGVETEIFRYESLWGNCCSTETTLRIHLFRETGEGKLWVAHTSPAWLGIGWWEAVGETRQEVVAEIQNQMISEGQAKGPWEFIGVKPSEFSSIFGEFFPGCDIEIGCKAAEGLRGPKASAAIIATLARWHLSKGVRATD